MPLDLTTLSTAPFRRLVATRRATRAERERNARRWEKRRDARRTQRTDRTPRRAIQIRPVWYQGAR